MPKETRFDLLNKRFNLNGRPDDFIERNFTPFLAKRIFADPNWQFILCGNGTWYVGFTEKDEKNKRIAVIRACLDDSKKEYCFMEYYTPLHNAPRRITLNN